MSLTDSGIFSVASRIQTYGRRCSLGTWFRDSPRWYSFIFITISVIANPNPTNEIQWTYLRLWAIGGQWTAPDRALVMICLLKRLPIPTNLDNASYALCDNWHLSVWTRLISALLELNQRSLNYPLCHSYHLANHQIKSLLRNPCLLLTRPKKMSISFSSIRSGSEYDDEDCPDYDAVVSDSSKRYVSDIRLSRHNVWIMGWSASLHHSWQYSSSHASIAIPWYPALISTKNILTWYAAPEIFFLSPSFFSMTLSGTSNFGSNENVDSSLRLSRLRRVSFFESSGTNRTDMYVVLRGDTRTRDSRLDMSDMSTLTVFWRMHPCSFWSRMSLASCSICPNNPFAVLNLKMASHYLGNIPFVWHSKPTVLRDNYANL